MYIKLNLQTTTRKLCLGKFKYILCFMFYQNRLTGRCTRNCIKCKGTCTYKN